MELLGPVHHLPGLRQAVREMLVVENGDSLPGLSEDRDDLFHHFVARIKNLSLVVEAASSALTVEGSPPASVRAAACFRNLRREQRRWRLSMGDSSLV